MPTMEKRVEELEKNTPKQTSHVYEMVIHWEDEAEYFRDGEPISRSQYFREAPKDNKPIEIHWGEPIPPREDDHENDK